MIRWLQFILCFAALINGQVSFASYSYLPNSDLVSSAAFKSNSTTVLITFKTWDYGYRLRSIQNVVGNASISGQSYLYDEIDRRVQAILADGSTWKFGYNDRNEVTSGKRYWSDFTPVSGQQYSYQYDAIGNRSAAYSGGDASGANLRLTRYQVNGLNQYVTNQNPQYLQIIGAASAPATVAVNGSAAYEKGEYFHKELSAGNGSGPNTVSASAIATYGATSATNSGKVLVAPATQSFQYDADGNLTNDSVWVYIWDAENRLVAMSNTTSVAAADRQKLEFSYNWEGKRVGKTVASWNAGLTNWSAPASSSLYLYDGWKLIAELDNSNPGLGVPIVRSYMWGLDISDSLDGAAGIGGLLMVTDSSTGTNYNHFATYDGNGNVTGLIKDDGTATAKYEYSPFGELIRSSGPMAKANPIRWSTKFWDEETGLSYYGYRYYSPALGRWLNRDSIEEEGGLNLFGFVGNNPINLFDPFGMTGTVVDTTAAAGEGAGLEGGASQAITLLNEVRSAVDAYNDAQQFISDLSEFANAVEGGDSIEILMAGLQAAGDALGSTLPGGRNGLKNSLHAAGNTTVYQAFGKNFETVYVGITKRFNARAAEHLGKKGINIVKIKGLERLSRKDARAAEQALIELHGLKSKGGSLMNIINSISKSNPAYAAMLKRGNELLKKAGYPGI